MAFTGEIVNGPSKWDLMLGLFDGNSSSRRSVVFSAVNLFNNIEEVAVFVNFLAREDGSGEKWNFAGFMIDAAWKAVAVKGYFSTQHRRGTMTVGT